MIKLKRIISSVIAFAAALTLLGGCGEKPLNDGGEQSKINSLPKNEIIVIRQDSSKEKYGDAKLYALEELTTSSPDGNISVYFWQDEQGGIYYSVKSGSDEVISPSRLGLTTSVCDFSTGIDSIISFDRPDEINKSYETALTVSLKDKNCVDHCMEREITLKKASGEKLTLMVRAYNDGFAYRYKDVCCGKDGMVFVTREASEINLPEGSVTFAGGYSATYEFEYVERSYKDFTSYGGIFNTPLTAQVGDNWLLFSESDVYANDISYIKSVFEKESGSTALKWAFGFERDPANEVTDELASPGHIRIEEVKTEAGFATPWRAAIIASDVNGLLSSDVIDSLCPEADEKLFKSTGWIKPGKVAWSWWSGCDQTSYDVAVDFVDFASEYGWEYCCLDVGWPAFEDRIPEICEYAKKKNVGIILWVNYLELKTPEEIEALFKQWSKWGVVGVKTDYFESDAIEALESMRNVAEIGAKYELMVYYHGCINPCGETRTYPNIMTSEAVLGEEFRKWSEIPTPKNCLMYPFTRNVTGSMDYTPSCMKIGKTGESDGFSLAKSIVYESALQHFASSAYSFPSFKGLPLLNRMPTAWVDSKVLGGYPGEYITYLRSDGEDFYIGAMTLEARAEKINLDFLPDGEYTAYIYFDENGGLSLKTQTVTNKDSIILDMPDIGGAAVLITKGEFDTSVKDSPLSELDGYTYYECETGALSGTAQISSSIMCSGEEKVGYVGNGAFNSLEMTVTADKDGEYELIVYYCTADERDLEIYIDGEKYELTDIVSRGFDIPASESLTVKLKKGENKITFTRTDGYAPDLDRIAVSDKPE